VNAIEMIVRCAIGQQGAYVIPEPDHGCGARPGETLPAGRTIAPVQDEGVVEGFRPIEVEFAAAMY